MNNNEACGYDWGDCCRPVLQCSSGQNNTNEICSMCHLTHTFHMTYKGKSKKYRLIMKTAFASLLLHYYLRYD